MEKEAVKRKEKTGFNWFKVIFVLDIIILFLRKIKEIYNLIF